MDCSEFITGFSDYYDRRTDELDAGAMEAHLDTCPSCRRYHAVVTQGGQLLRSLPSPAIRQDFRPRLEHRIYHVQDEAALSRSASSGTTGVTALAMAVLLTVAAWTPVVREVPPEAAAPPVVLDPVTPIRPEFAAPRSLFDEPPPQPDVPLTRPGLWVDSHSLLYEYSALSAKYRQTVELRRTGLE